MSQILDHLTVGFQRMVGMLAREFKVSTFEVLHKMMTIKDEKEEERLIFTRLAGRPDFKISPLGMVTLAVHLGLSLTSYQVRTSSYIVI